MRSARSQRRLFQPSERRWISRRTVEVTLLDQQWRFRVRRVLFDSFQIASTTQRVQKVGVPMREFAQRPANLTVIGNNLFELDMAFVSLRLWMIATRQRREAVTDWCYLRNRSLCACPPGESPACRYKGASRRYYDALVREFVSKHWGGSRLNN